MDQKALLDLQRLTDRAVHRFASAQGTLGKLELNHLKAFLSQIESAVGVLRCDEEMKDEVAVIDTQLSLLRSVYEKNTTGSGGSVGKLAVFDSDSDGDDDNKPLIPKKAESPGPEPRYSTSLRSRPSAKPPKHPTQPTADKTIFRQEHDELSAALLHHSAALKANSERMAALLKDDRESVDQVERLMDTTEGSFSGHTKRLGEQVKAESWGLLTVLMVLVVGFVMFLFMFVFIRLT